jgi:hypothetical protein
VKLTIGDAVRTVINTRCGSAKRGRLKRQRVYAFHCLDCEVEVFYTRAELEHKKTAIVVCCGPCNRIKGSVLTYEQMMRLAPLLREFVREETDEA